VGPAARPLFEDAQRLLQRIVSERRFCARAAFGLFPANSVGDDDIEVYTDESRKHVRMTLHHLRQQQQKADNKPNYCLADFVAPRSAGLHDHIGLFAVTAGLGIDSRVREFETAHDDYSAILLKALADRLAEALAEHMHLRVRKELWGYASEESLQPAGLIGERYQGIRPAPGYPACPEHSEKEKIFRLLGAAEHAGMSLTGGYAMLPAASVCGYYFALPESRYFVLGQVLSDQLEDYARRKGCSSDELRRLMPANLHDQN